MALDLRALFNSSAFTRRQSETLSQCLELTLATARTPAVIERNESRSFMPSDSGQAIVKTDGAAYNWTVSANVWQSGMSVLVINDGAAGDITIVEGADMILADGTLTGNITVAPGQSRLLFGILRTKVRALW